MEKIQLDQDMMNILLAAKHGDVEKTIIQLVYGRDDVDYEDRLYTLSYWLETVVNNIATQEHKCHVGCRYTLSEFMRYHDTHNTFYNKKNSLQYSIISFFKMKLEMCRFRYNGEDIFEVTED